MEKVGIVITCYNSVNYTANAVNSIKSSFPYSLIIVDDFSTDNTKLFTASTVKTYNHLWLNHQEGSWADVKIITDEPTNSLGEKWNLGVEEAIKLGCKLCFVCNNDILFSPYTIDGVVKRWLKAKEEGDKIGIVSAVNQRGQMEPTRVLSLPEPKDVSEAESPDFSCFAVDTDVWQEVGKFPTEYIPCYFEDGDFHCTLAKHGYKAIATTAAPYYHFGSITQNSVPNGVCPSPQFEKLREVFRAKWGFAPGEQAYDNYVHRKVSV